MALFILSHSMNLLAESPVVPSDTSNPSSIPEKIKQRLLTKGFEVDEVSPSEITGLYEVIIGPKIFYVSEDARYLLMGKMYDSETQEDLSEKKVSKARLASLEKVGTDNMVVFKPKETKHVVHVFTDIDCGYCRKLHSQIDDYLDKGIEVRYLFFPRAGTGSSSYSKAETVWCADDRNEALTQSKAGKKLPTKTCKNPVTEHMQLGEAFGLRGTPMIITEKGRMLPGYVEAKPLEELLNKEKGVTPEVKSPLRIK